VVNERPALTSAMTEEEFRSWYWLKAELVTFCRAERLPYSGNKSDIERVISAHLAGVPYRAVASPARLPKRKTITMPTSFTLTDTIGEGWTCNPALGSFFRQQVGSGFRFNKAMRDFIHGGAGRTLAEAVDCYRVSVAPGQPKREIAASLEYNQHTRAYYADHPQATRAEVIAAWWTKRGTRRE
jgi:hypothetical protein